MSHGTQMFFVEKMSKHFPTYFNDKHVLEVGSLDINGSVRKFFKNCEYTGIDLGEGPGVDVVENGATFKSSKLFDTTISCECFEHDATWKETFQNMINNTKNNGMVIFTAASTGRREHGTMNRFPESSPFTCSNNYYQNLTVKDFINNFNFESIFRWYTFEFKDIPGDIYFAGIKHKVDN